MQSGRIHLEKNETLASAFSRISSLDRKRYDTDLVFNPGIHQEHELCIISSSKEARPTRINEIQMQRGNSNK